LGSERVELRPLIRRKKLDRGKNPRPFIGPSCSFTSSNELGLFVTLPLSSLVSIEPTDPHDIPPLLRISMIAKTSAAVPHIWHSPRSIVPRRSAIASFARAESAARVASSRRAAASRRCVTSC